MRLDSLHVEDTLFEDLILGIEQAFFPFRAPRQEANDMMGRRTALQAYIIEVILGTAVKTRDELGIEKIAMIRVRAMDRPPRWARGRSAGGGLPPRPARDRDRRHRAS